MEADKFLLQQFIRGLDHQEGRFVSFLIIEGRVGLNGALVVALRVSASVGVCSRNILLL
jgi:hypothetical protein